MTLDEAQLLVMRGSPALQATAPSAVGRLRLGSVPVTRTETILSLGLGLVSVVSIVMQVADLMSHAGQLAGFVGGDFVVVRDAAARWLAGGSFYDPAQLQAPYSWPGPWVLYPPPALLLFVPFAWLPAITWWAVPIGLVGWTIARHRPRPLALAAILFCLTNPTVHSVIFWGNPTMWITAALALGTVYRWPAVLILAKPTLLPFAFFGVRNRSWWVVGAGLAFASALFLPMWADYLTVVSNARPDGGSLLYSFYHVPTLLIPLAAWLGRQQS